MTNFDAFKMGFWGTFGRTTAKLLIITVGGKIIFSRVKKALRKNGKEATETVIDTIKTAITDKLGTLSDEELDQLKNILKKLEDNPETETDEEK